MPDIKGTTRAQTRFLRAFRSSPTGPAPALLRRWLRRPAVRAAPPSVRHALRFLADLQISNAATRAAQKLAAADDADLTPSALEKLLRLSHLRQRFQAEDPLTRRATGPCAAADAHDTCGLTKQQIAEATG